MSRRLLPLPFRFLPVAAVLTALGLLWVTASPGAAAGQPSFQPGSRGFHSVLAYGQGESTSALALAQNQADGSIPPSFTSQAKLYDAVITKQPTASLDGYYKDSSFSVPQGGTTEQVGAATVVRDATYQVPHIYGQTRDAGMFAVGWATAQDRLFLMDVLRRTSQGSTAELLGPAAIPADSAALGQFDRSPAELTAEVMRLPQDEGATGARALRDLQQYVAGINAWIGATRTDPTKLPAEYPALGAVPRDWTLADTASVGYLLIAQFTVFGDGEDNQADVLARLKAKLGDVKGQHTYDDLRRLEDPAAPVTADRSFTSDRPASGPSSAARLDAASITARNAVVSGGAALPGGRAFPAWATALATQGLGLEHHASSALLVTADKSATGRALAAMGPQVGYYSPAILVEYELHAPGVHASGMSFPGASPFPLIGHTGDFAWSGTTANGDNADTFAEVLCDPSGAAPTASSDHYRYRGNCIPFTHRDQVLLTPVAPTAPQPPQRVTLRTMRSVHGSIHGFATVGGGPVALARSTAVNGHGIRGLTAFQRLAEGGVKTPEQFVAAMRHYTGNENWFYVSQDHIAWLASGWFPQHAAGTDLELPILGTGEWDWKGFDPETQGFTRHADSFNPTAIDPAQGYLVSWNNKGAHGWRAAPGIWSYGRVHRSQLLEVPLTALLARQQVTLPQLAGIVGDAATQDPRATFVLPDLLAALGTVTDPVQARLVTALRAWLASGAHRRDTTDKGYDDHSAAVLIFDTFWRGLVHDLYDPALGLDVVALLQGPIDLVLDGRAVEGGFYDGWYGQVSAVVRQALGAADPDAPTATSCGDGTLRGCRTVLRTSFASSVKTLTTSLGADPGSWRQPVLCPADPTPTCDENRPITAGALATPSRPFQNRGTFHQAVELLGPATTHGATPLGGVQAVPGPSAQTGLAATGAAPLAGVLALLLLTAAAGARQLRSD